MRIQKIIPAKQLHDQTDQNVQQTTAQNHPEGIRQEINPDEEGVF